VDVIDNGRSGLPQWREATGTCVWFELAPED